MPDAGPDEADGSVSDAAVADDAGLSSGDSGIDAGSTDASVSDAGTDAGPGVDAGQLVTLTVPKEMRAVWVATVANIDFPTSQSLSPDAGIAQLAAIVDSAVALRLNAIVFQVRPESDALYVSTREPWSRFLTGTQGQNPGYDPLQSLINLAHAQGIEVHAWVNPYRGLTSASVTAAATRITRVLSQDAITYNNIVVMDPSSKNVRTWVVNEVRDLTRTYDIDGVHFDDYFYPYPTSQAFPDSVQYQAYVSDGGTMSKGDWRRDNVNQLVQKASQAIASEKQHVRFGISPFGIYRPGIPPGINGLDAYEAISCDPLTWLNQGWVDYVAPQLYWPSTQTAQAFGTLINWWAAQVRNGQTVMSGHSLSNLGSSSAWTLSEFRTQVQLARAKAPAVGGQFWFSYNAMKNDSKGARTMLQNDVYPTLALPPPMASQRNATFAVPTVSLSGTTVTLSHSQPGQVRVYALYQQSLGQWQLKKVVSATAPAQVLTPGRWAISAVNRADVESQGVVIDAL